MTFYIPLLNPLRFVGGAGNKFDTLLMVDLINKYQEEKCYFQKWQVGDSTKMQILSDWEFTFKIYDVYTNAEVEVIVPEEFVNAIADHTFKVYTVDIPFVDIGKFYAVIEYDGNTQISEPWEVEESQPATLLYRYRNSENAFSVVFDQGFEFDLRVEGVVANFEPKSDDVIYNDQLKNSRILNSVPWRSFTMFVGNEEGLPDWIVDKVNRIMSCDVVHVDSPTFDGYISKVEGAEWEVVRGGEQPFSGIRIEIMTVDNSLLERLKRTEAGGGTGLNYTVVQKVSNYYGVSTTLSIPTAFGKYRMLEKIGIEKEAGAPPFTLFVGTTNGGSQIGQFVIDEADAVVTINKLFLAETPVFLSGFTSQLPFLSVIYKNLIENPAGTGAPTSGAIPLGMIAMYSPMDGRSISDDFNLTDGLGLEDTDYYGWSICNGLNGTPDLGERFVLGLKNTVNNDGQTGGEKEVSLTADQNGPHTHGYRNAVGSDYERGNTGTEFFRDGRNDFAQTQTSGQGLPHNNMPPYIVKAFIQKIF